MKKIDNLIKLMQNIEQELSMCVRCGMCQAACPIYMETRNEVDVARGKLAILDGISSGLLNNPEEISKRLQRCLLCGSCMTGCPRGVETLYIFIKARIILAEYQGLSLLEKLIFRMVLSNPRKFKIILNWIASLQKLVLKEANSFHETSDFTINIPFIQKRYITPLAKKNFLKTINSRSKNQSGNSIKIAFFVGCLLDRIFPEVAEDIVNIFDYLGLHLVIPENQCCCGMPALAAGDSKTFFSLMEANLKTFKAHEVDFIISGCATCTSTIKEIWPMMAQYRKPSMVHSAKEISRKTVDISKFLVDFTDILIMFTPSSHTTVTYHDPCHLRKVLGIWKQPRQLLTSICGNNFKEMKYADNCCGFGGTFGIKHHQISEKIGLKKIESIIDSRAQVVTTSCPACMIQLKGMLSKTNHEIKVDHIISFIWRESQTQMFNELRKKQKERLRKPTKVS